MKLRFGTAGLPIVTEPRNTENGIATVRTLGLDALELEFVHSVNIRPEKAKELKKIANQHDIVLTCHAPYYINLNAKEAEKRNASLQRLLNSCRILSLAGGWSCVVHAAYLLGEPEEKVTQKLIPIFKKIVATLRNEGHDVWVRPEFAGKLAQWASLEGLVTVSEAVDGMLPCIDFAHAHAYTNGKYNHAAEIRELLTTLEKRLGRTCLNNMHIHIAGIAYGPKGERNHLNLADADLKYKEILKVWKEFKLGGVVICESPNIEKDALKLQKQYQQQ
ncbi:MAG: TIM barrel protein [Nanoarchaeota archaeon]|nr:TIM barrel protein [Nanoarchaeota archaeon]